MQRQGRHKHTIPMYEVARSQRKGKGANGKNTMSQNKNELCIPIKKNAQEKRGMYGGGKCGMYGEGDGEKHIQGQVCAGRQWSPCSFLQTWSLQTNCLTCCLLFLSVPVPLPAHCLVLFHLHHHLPSHAHQTPLPRPSLEWKYIITGLSCGHDWEMVRMVCFLRDLGQGDWGQRAKLERESI